MNSSQDFVRSLKLASDPPLVGGPYKIEIAQQAWEDASFYVPSKAEVIADWILAKFLKDKGKEMYGFFWVVPSAIFKSYVVVLRIQCLIYVIGGFFSNSLLLFRKTRTSLAQLNRGWHHYFIASPLDQSLWSF
jgi:hypothetical protein